LAERGVVNCIGNDMIPVQLQRGVLVACTPEFRLANSLRSRCALYRRTFGIHNPTASTRTPTTVPPNQSFDRTLLDKAAQRR
jgi:hypothetical protein